MIIKNIKDKEYSKINNLALPLILNNVSALIIDFCDQAMVGRTSLTAFASVGVITGTIYSITGVLGATSVAFNIIGARCKGKKDTEELNSNFLFNLVLNLIIGFILFIVTLSFGKTALKLFYGFNGKVLSEAFDYLSIFSLSIGLNMLLFTFSSYLKIINKTKYIFYGNISSAISNVIFDYILIFGHFGMPTMGIKGNAIGSVLALILNLIIYIIVIKKYNLLQKSKVQILKKAKETIKISLPIMGQEFLESTLLVLITNAILTRVGILEVSIYNILFTIINIALMPMYAYSQASLTIVSENIGAENKDNILKTPRKCLLMAMIFYIMISIVILSLKSHIPAIITNDAKLIKSSISFMSSVVFVNILNIPSTIYKCSLQSIKDEKWVFLSSLFINLAGSGIIAVLALCFKLSLYGVYFGMLINYILLAAVFFTRYTWMLKNVEMFTKFRQ